LPLLMEAQPSSRTSIAETRKNGHRSAMNGKPKMQADSESKVKHS